METTKTTPKSKIKNKKGQPIEKHLKNQKRKLTKKIKKYTKNKNTLLLGWGGGGGGAIFLHFLLLCSCCTPATNHHRQQSRQHPPQDRHLKYHLHLIICQKHKRKKRQRLGGSTYRSRKSLQTLKYIFTPKIGTKTIFGMSSLKITLSANSDKGVGQYLTTDVMEVIKLYGF